jgi:hypothetical protein
LPFLCELAHTTGIVHARSGASRRAIGAVKWLMQTEPQDAGILTLFLFPVWCCLVVVGLLIGRRLGRSATGAGRIAPR